MSKFVCISFVKFSFYSMIHPPGFAYCHFIPGATMLFFILLLSEKEEKREREIGKGKGKFNAQSTAPRLIWLSGHVTCDRQTTMQPFCLYSRGSATKCGEVNTPSLVYLPRVPYLSVPNLSI